VPLFAVASLAPVRLIIELRMFSLLLHFQLRVRLYDLHSRNLTLHLVRVRHKRVTLDIVTLLMMWQSRSARPATCR
jgi:hypothetical protein